MTRDEKEKANICPECGASSYEGCFCSLRGAKRASKTKDQADDMDSARHMNSTFGKRMRTFYSEIEPADALNENTAVFDLRAHIHRSLPVRASTAHPQEPPPRPTIFYVHPDGTVLKNPPPSGRPISELIDEINRRGGYSVNNRNA